MGTHVVAVDRVFTPTGVPNVGENEATSWNVGDKLLLVFAAFIAVVCGGSGLALLVISIASFFD
jgi:hypothetical protein